MEKAPHFAVVDVETTGGKPEYARIIEIGIVQRRTVQKPADSHQNGRFSRIVVTDQGCKIA